MLLKVLNAITEESCLENSSPRSEGCPQAQAAPLTYAITRSCTRISPRGRCSGMRLTLTGSLPTEWLRSYFGKQRARKLVFPARAAVKSGEPVGRQFDRWSVGCLGSQDILNRDKSPAHTPDHLLPSPFSLPLFPLPPLAAVYPPTPVPPPPPPPHGVSSRVCDPRILVEVERWIPTLSSPIQRPGRSCAAWQLMRSAEMLVGGKQAFVGSEITMERPETLAGEANPMYAHE